jgi:hypothetical protein
MNWPDDTTCKRICALWGLGYGSTNVGESTNALAALGRLQAELGLSDVELAFIAEYTEKEPVPRVPSRVVLEFGDAISGISRVSGQAARSIG